MPIEIRELIIKTTIDGDSKTKSNLDSVSLGLQNDKFKKQLMDECKNYINQKVNEIKER